MNKEFKRNKKKSNQRLNTHGFVDKHVLKNGRNKINIPVGATYDFQPMESSNETCIFSFGGHKDKTNEVHFLLLGNNQEAVPRDGHYLEPLGSVSKNNNTTLSFVFVEKPFNLD